MTEQTNRYGAEIAKAHGRGRVAVALAAVLGIAVAGWLAGWFGPSVAVMQNLTIFQSRGGEMPRPAHGLVLTSENRGQVLFGRSCDSCHPGGGEGRGPSLVSPDFRRDFLTERDVIQLVRDGTCEMPKFDRFLLADDALAEIAKYVKARAASVGALEGKPQLAPLDGPGIFQQKCADCHVRIDKPVDARDVQVLYALDEMAKCGGLTTDQKSVLKTYLQQMQAGGAAGR